MVNDRKNNDMFIDDNETEQDLLSALSEISDEEIREINEKYD